LNEKLDYADEDDGDFGRLSISCARLHGIVFKTDARKVHQLLVGFVQKQTAATWIKDSKKKQDGRINIKSLRGSLQWRRSQVDTTDKPSSLSVIF
jgi:hypothetical protein